MPPIGNQREWPSTKDDGSDRTSPTGYFQTANVIQRSDRSVAGPLRLGTEPRVGPKGAIRNGNSDFEMDRITPRGFDPMGSHNTREPPQPASSLLSREVRRGKNRD